MRLKDTKTPPPIGFVYQDYDTKAVVTAITFEELIARVNHHRHLNGLTLNGNQEQMVHDQMCDKLGSEYCEKTGVGDVVHAVAKPIAVAIDKIAGTNIQGCGSCAKRRAKLNT